MFNARALLSVLVLGLAVSSHAHAQTTVSAHTPVSGVEWRAPANTVASELDDTSETGPVNVSWTATPVPMSDAAASQNVASASVDERDDSDSGVGTINYSWVAPAAARVGR